MAPSTFFSFLLLLMMMMMQPLNVYSQSANTSFEINAFTSTSLKLTYERDSFVPPDEIFVRFTKVNDSGFPLTYGVGRVLYNQPVQMWDTRKQASFDTTITLQMTAMPGDPNTPGHGMTFFIVPVNSTVSTGGVGNNLGIYNAVTPCSPIFAVEFDIVGSAEHDPTYKHIGININSQGSQNSTRVDDILGQRVTARITYNAPTRKINVVATYGSKTATVSYAYNLKMILPKQVQVGLSASTGDGFVAYHDAYTWHFNSTLVNDVNTLEEDHAYIKKIHVI